jgi:tetratricopeptide (TPR) repeat protein
MKSSNLVTVVVFLLLQFGCVSAPFPYFDSALNDHNRAPASLAAPAEYINLNSSDETEQKIKLDTFFLKAEMDSLEGKSESAIENFKSAISLDPDSEILAYRLAVEYYRKGQLRDAIYWGEKSLEKKSDKRETVLFVAGLLSAQKNFERAEQLYKKLIQKSSSDSEAHLYLAALYSEKKDYPKAIKHFSELISHKSFEQRHLAYYYRARVYIESAMSGGVAKAKKDLKSSLNLKPEFFDALQVLGRLIEKTDGKEASFKFFAKYQTEHGPSAKVAEILSQYYIEKGDYDKAYGQLEILESTTDDQIQVKLKMSLILIDKKMYDLALNKLTELHQIVPESDKVKFYLAAVYQETQKIDKAVETFLQIQSASNHYEDSRIQAAMLLKNSGKSEQAFILMKESLSHKSENIQSFFVTAQILEDQKKYDEAISYLKLADAKFPKNSQTNYFLGTLFDRKNDKENMLSHMNKVIEIDSDHIQALNYVAYSLAEMKKDLPRAEELALKAVQLDKSDAFIKDTLGWVYYQKGEFEKAVQILEKAHKELPDVGIIADHLGDAYLKLKKNNKAMQTFQKAFDLENDSAKKKLIENKIVDIKNSENNRKPASE